ncbi:MAG: hypothetical protein F6K48_33225 [Okeania sp. SIO3H1]|uniref:hypothetical protein n=1 Tax=Okeania sp. SIO1I7 TaxID=2607772 RepID=UPI0013CCC854|nr:hypothetical protein [Okeania sp. SIO1I7]NEN93482.1 hypothetical protein [Okeania sp. SIO3H1]NET27703.1 hypothetical protein [Okeania sp. SIO1I7]
MNNQILSNQKIKEQEQSNTEICSTWPCVADRTINFIVVHREAGLLISSAVGLSIIIYVGTISAVKLIKAIGK